MLKEIVVIGSINQDLVFEVEEIVPSGKTIFSSGQAVYNGGKGANQAISAARMNSKVNFVGAVGKDEAGNHMIQAFKDENIQIEGIMHVDKPTGTAIIQIDQNGANAIIVNQGANFAITKDMIDRHEHILKKCEYCILQFEIPMDVIHYVIDKCAHLGVKVILNPAPYVAHFDLNYLHKVHAFVPNEHEFAQMMHLDEVDEDNVAVLAEDFYHKYQTNLIVTLGKEGSYYHGHEGHFHQKAKRVDAIDTTAAGDSFIGSLTSFLAKGKSFKEAMALSTLVSAITVTKKGAQASIPFYEELALAKEN